MGRDTALRSMFTTSIAAIKVTAAVTALFVAWLATQAPARISWAERLADLARLLVSMGARIEGAGTERIEIEGVPELGGARHRIIPDRIEAGTLLVAGAITGGDVTLTGAAPRHLTATLAKLEECGAAITVDGDRVRCQGPERPLPAARLRPLTEPVRRVARRRPEQPGLVLARAPRDDRAVDHRPGGLEWLHPHGQRAGRRPL